MKLTWQAPLPTLVRVQMCDSLIGKSNAFLHLPESMAFKLISCRLLGAAPPS